MAVVSGAATCISLQGTDRLKARFLGFGGAISTAPTVSQELERGCLGAAAGELGSEGALEMGTRLVSPFIS